MPSIHPPKPSLHSLSGEALFDALKSDNYRVPAKKRGGKRPAPPRPTDPLAPLATAGMTWQDHSLVLMVLRTDCACGKHYESPNTHMFLRRETSGAAHYTPLEANITDPETRFVDLPTAIEYRDTQVASCQFCFDLAHVMLAAKDHTPCTQTSAKPYLSDSSSAPSQAASAPPSPDSSSSPSDPSSPLEQLIQPSTQPSVLESLSLVQPSSPPSPGEPEEPVDPQDVYDLLDSLEDL